MLPRRTYGALLVEALVSFLIFLVATMSLYGLLATARRSQARARQLTAASQLGRELLERYRARSFADITPGLEKGRVRLETRRDNLPGVLVLDYQVEVSSGPGNLKSVMATVWWTQEPAGKVEMESYVGP